MFYFSLLGRDTVVSFLIYCVYVLDHSNVGQWNIVSVFTLSWKRQHFQRETMMLSLLPSCSSSLFPRCPLPDLPQFESNHQCPIGCSNHVTYIGPQTFSHGSCLQSQCGCVCVFEHIREKSPTPSPPSPSYLLSTIPLSLLFFPPPPILWNTVSHFR